MKELLLAIIFTGALATSSLPACVTAYETQVAFSDTQGETLRLGTKRYSKASADKLLTDLPRVSNLSSFLHMSVVNLQSKRVRVQSHASAGTWIESSEFLSGRLSLPAWRVLEKLFSDIQDLVAEILADPRDLRRFMYSKPTSMDVTDEIPNPNGLINRVAMIAHEEGGEILPDLEAHGDLNNCELLMNKHALRLMNYGFVNRYAAAQVRREHRCFVCFTF